MYMFQISKPILVKTTRDVNVSQNLRLAKRVRDQNSYDSIPYVIMHLEAIYTHTTQSFSHLLTLHLVTHY